MCKRQTSYLQLAWSDLKHQPHCIHDLGELMKVGDLVAFWNSDRRRIGIIVATGIRSWDMRADVVRVQWSDGAVFEYHTRDLVVISEDG
jgi:hypothetical protein